MDESIEKRLSEMPVSQLVKIIQSALTAMDEDEQINFIAKHIDARTSLTRLGANDPDALLHEIEAFCQDCLNGVYYSSEDDIETYLVESVYSANNYYDDDWDYDEYFSNTEWAKTFGKLFKLSGMYIQSNDFETGYEATARLLSCLKELMSSESFLGTDEPMTYIDTDWNELFALHYDALFKRHQDSGKAVKMAFRRWADFGSYCGEAFLSNVKDAAAAEHCILEEIQKSNKWIFQRDCFQLLVQLCNRLDEAFDMAIHAEELLDCNVYFYLMLVEGLYEKGRYHEAVEAARTALTKIQPADDAGNTRDAREQNEIRAGIQTKLTDAYEQLQDYTKAFETAANMFKESPSYSLYKRARSLSEKAEGASPFKTFAESVLIKEEDSAGYSRYNLLRDIYSYEGDTVKLTAAAESRIIDTNYYDRKYTALSLIYRAVNLVPNVGTNLAEYISSAAGQDGIYDMRLYNGGGTPQTDLLLQGAGLLRGIIAFHINAANRNRYAKAAYYMCVMRDIFILIGMEDDFKAYFHEVIQQNIRHPALRDEMSIVYGKAAVAVNKRK